MEAEGKSRIKIGGTAQDTADRLPAYIKPTNPPQSGSAAKGRPANG